MIPIIFYDELVRSLDWRDAVEAIRRGHLRPKGEIGDVLLGPSSGVLLTRAAFIEGLGYLVKAETAMMANASRGLPTVQGAVLVYSAGTGALRAMIESRLVTEYKTAADSVLGARLLARHLVIVGAGVMSACLARAYQAAFPGLERISIWARRPEQAQALASALDMPGAATAVDDLPAALVDADMVSTATMARAPVLAGEWIRPGTHVDLVGAYLPDMREADDDLIAKASVFVDSKQTTMHIGEIAAPIAAKAVTPDFVYGDLYDIVALNNPARSSAEEITVFKNGGGAHLDLMIADYIAEAAGY